ncbi:alpha/beta hydrolase family protein [Alkalicoccus halolimnae]|uniref:Alpha/beta hydrolase n=1 Tax=Alkalicoccus halolimnae TaxID=1667239 RepID=A0AAJ8MZK2_9BACI|nr:hypothetical protein [Alkalicoccus halolimnae]
MEYQDFYRQSPYVKTEKSRFQKFASWWKKRLKVMAAWDEDLEGVILAMYAASMAAAAIAALAMPTGLGRAVDLIVFMSANTAAFAGISFAAAYLLSLLYVPLPRLILSASAYTAFLAYYIQDEANLGVYFTSIMTGIFIISAYVLGALLQIWMSRLPAPKKLIYSFIPVSWFLLLIFFHPTIEEHDATSTFTSSEGVSTVQTADPGEPGGYNAELIYYSNGEDRHRQHFAEGTDILSESVDASRYFSDDEWENWRTSFWGFDDSAFPLNGEMWMPEGEGPFPVVLMTHGNHRMENFSDAGYTYLGEHLASHGYAAVSIDQNFVNYSNWTGSPNEDMKLRAWLFMQHLLELQKFNEETETLQGRLNMDHIALIGHSRGGQAAAMTAEYEKFFEEDPALEGMDELEITSVIGLAPTDQQVDDMRPAPVNVNYLSLHGARDGDVHNFRGDRQYGRVELDGSGDFMKAAVYVAEANHSQFNTDWGRTDMRLPGSLFLSREQMMEPEEQQKLAKVFTTAFLETTIRGEEEYEQLFRDVRTGRNWLPDTQYVTRYSNSAYSPLVTFNRENDREQFPEGVTASGNDFESWQKVSTLDRAGSRKAPDGVQLEWETEASYHLELPDGYAEDYFNENKSYFSFSMAQMDRELSGNDRGTTDPEVYLRFTFRSGEETLINVEDFYTIPSSIWTQYSRYPFLEDYFRDGKYEEPIEPAFQTYLFETELIEQGQDLSELEQITWEFQNGPGSLVIDEIGFLED